MKTEEQIRKQAVSEVEAWLRQRAIRLSKEKAYEPLEIVVLMAAAEDLASECLWMT